MKNDFILFASSYPDAMRAQILQAAHDLGYQEIQASIGAFSSGERFCELMENGTDITGGTVHVLMNMSSDMNTDTINMINIAATLKEYGVAKVHAVMPFVPYTRQDRTFAGRKVSVMAKTYPKLLKAAGVDYITTIDMHSIAAENFYKDAFGTDNVQLLSAAKELCTAVGVDVIEKVGAPDGGDKPNDVAQRKAHELAMFINDKRVADGHVADDLSFAITKRHLGVNTTEVVEFRGNVKGCNALEIDDMTDTGGTLLNGAETLKNNGARQRIAVVTHGIFSGSSLDVLTSQQIKGRENPINLLVVTDSLIDIYKKFENLSKEQQEKILIVPTENILKQALTLNCA